MNNGVAPCTFVVTPNAYYVNHERWTLTVPAGGQVEQAWPLANSNAWYDFSVTLNEDPAYLRRFAGRVETGRHGSSDPAMGTWSRRAPRPGGRGRAVHGPGVRPQRAACAARARNRVAGRADRRGDALARMLAPFQHADRARRGPQVGRQRQDAQLRTLLPVRAIDQRQQRHADFLAHQLDQGLDRVQFRNSFSGTARRRSGGRSAARALGAVETQEGVAPAPGARPAGRAGGRSPPALLHTAASSGCHLAAGLDQEGGIQVAVLDAAGQLAGLARQHARPASDAPSSGPTPPWTACPCRTRCCPPTPNRPARPARARRAQAVVHVQQLPGFGQQLAAGGVEDGQPAAAVEQLAAQFGFQGAHLEADGCLGEGDLLGCFGEGAVMRHRQESAQKRMVLMASSGVNTVLPPPWRERVLAARGVSTGRGEAGHRFTKFSL